MSDYRLSADERLLSSTLVPRIDLCEFSRYRSRLDHLLVTRPRNSQQTIQGTVFRSNRDGTSTATKIHVKHRDKKRFYTTTNSNKEPNALYLHRYKCIMKYQSILKL